MREREQYLKELREQDENEEEESVLEVFNDGNADSPQVQQGDDSESKGPAISTMTGGKKRRKAMDPFACTSHSIFIQGRQAAEIILQHSIRKPFFGTVFIDRESRACRRRCERI
jgi:hypothetical protein